MSEKCYCGECGTLFEPKPYFYGGSNLCDSCREKKSETILKAKEAYDGMSPQDREGKDFARTIDSAVPQRRVENTCCRCGTTISEGTWCSSCKSKREREEKEAEKKALLAKRDFDKQVGRL